MSKRTYEEYIKNDCHPVGYNEPCQSYYFAQSSVDLLLDKIDQLKQQLKEYKNKENTSAVNSLDEMLKNCENCGLNECIGCEYTQTCVQNIKQQLAEKDNLIEYAKEEIRKRNKRINEIVERDKKLFDDKNKEIEKLKQQYTILENENGKLTTELIMDKYKKAQKEVSFGKQLAIQELEKVKMLIEWKFNSIVEVREYLQQQIKLLKGEKDE